jgi:putative salt-induced outer membrane protein YdiY
MYKKAIFYILLATINFSNFYMFGQVVNIEKKRKLKGDGFSGSVGLGFFFLDNASRISNLENALDLQYRKGAHTFILLNDLNLMRVDKSNLVNAGFQHLRYNYTIKDSSFLTFELFAQHQYNTIKMLNRRLLGGAGPRFSIVNKTKTALTIGTLAMYEFEELTDSVHTQRQTGRLGSYMSFRWEILQNLSLSTITYFQPAFANPENFRLSSETNLRLKITDALSFKVGFQANYDSKPPENVQKLFYNWQNEITYEF